MIMKKLAFATLVAMGMTAVAIAQQPSQQPATQPSTQPRQQPPSAQTAPAPHGGDRTEQVAFDKADKNSDGKVSREEANDIDGFDFSRADTNSDASLSRQEYQAAMATSTPRGDSGSARSGDAAPGAGQQRQAQATFDTADKDKDGKITRDEASTVSGLNFTSADTNADASLSRQEYQVAMAGAQPRG
jgi:EF hand